MNKLVIAAAAFLALSQLTPADPVREQGVINQTGGYGQTLRFIPHPAQLWLSHIAPDELNEHPAVIARGNAVPANEYAYGFYPHPTGGGYALPDRN